ncbi:hypothetical protein RRG08_056179 [Elysia crispata]|uniref:Uncharacterized protein n=1 Tax=Elysia crispata TaxID=231223 RepID=A0AAE1D7X3_9GAST|nr:hypothetical protein RRG08_056179 [Elysia crispata]
MWSYHISILVPLSTARVSLEFDRRRLIVSRSVRDLSRSVSDCISLPLRRCSFKAEKGESMRFRSTETIYLDKVRLVGHLVDIPDQDKLISWFLLDHRNLCQSRAKGRDPLLCEEKYCTDLKLATSLFLSISTKFKATYGCGRNSCPGIEDDVACSYINKLG